MAITAGSGAAIPQDPLNAAQGPIAQAGPAESQVVRNSLGALGVEGYPRPLTPKGPFATSHFAAEAAKVEQYRAQTQSAFGSNGKMGNFYVFTDWSPTASRSYESIDNLMSEFEAMSIKQKRNIAKVLAMAGFLDAAYAQNLEDIVERATLDDVAAAYSEVLSAAAARFAQGQNITVDELLEMHIRYNMAGTNIDTDEPFSIDNAAKWWDKAVEDEESQARVEVTTQRNVDLFSPVDARGLTRQTMQGILGRDPTEEEFEDFVAALQTAARQNPTITRTRARYDEEGNLVNSRTTTRGGLTSSGIEEVLTEQAQAAPDYAEWQAVGTYFPEVMNSLGSVVPGA